MLIFPEDGKGKQSTMLKVPIQKWKLRADIIIAGDEKAKTGSVQIASVGISLSTAVRRSVFGQDQSIYVASRV